MNNIYLLPDCMGHEEMSLPSTHSLCNNTKCAEIFLRMDHFAGWFYSEHSRRLYTFAM